MGDGSAAYAIQALWSAAQPQWPVTCILFKNRRYAALQDFSKVFGYRLGENAAGTALPGIDSVGLPKGPGCGAIQITEASSLREILTDALHNPPCHADRGRGGLISSPYFWEINFEDRTSTGISQHRHSGGWRHGYAVWHPAGLRGHPCHLSGCQPRLAPDHTRTRLAL
ncbi:MAG: hypothetical protein LBE58_17610 [Comamonas sp.]|nr:hypothetical protein [Comamonas sp.]